VAIELISTHIRQKLSERARHFRPKMAMAHPSTTAVPPAGSPENLNVVVLPQTPQLQA
jgi:hypothetical protein